MSSIKVKLTKQVEIFGKRVAEIVMKEPMGGQYTRIGDPRTLVFSTTGSGYWVEDKTAIVAYYEALIEHDAGGEALVPVHQRDAMRVKETDSLFSLRRRSRRLSKENRRSLLRRKPNSVSHRAVDDDRRDL